MSRMRQIPVTDVTLQERVINQNVSHPVMRPAAPNCRVRPRKVPASKFRLSDTPALISNGCSSVREFCNNVQSITVDLNNLIGSVESILPLLTTYLTALQARSMPAEQPPAATEPPIEVTAVHRPEEQPAAPTAPTAQTTAPAGANQHTAHSPPGRYPAATGKSAGEESAQQFYAQCIGQQHSQQ